MSSRDDRLIEDYLPIKAISAEGSREKSVRRGHISTVHLWWARRPITACRAAVYGALVSADSFRPRSGPENKRESLGRASAAKFVSRLCTYPGDPSTMVEAEHHILDAHAARLSREAGARVSKEDIAAGKHPRPRVLDLFAGGGSMPLEALRLGCEAFALDLNPVAHFVELCTLVFPQKFGAKDPKARGCAADGSWAGLEEEIRHWGNWVLGHVVGEIGDMFRPIPDPAFSGRRVPIQQGIWSAATGGLPTGYLMPVAYLWTRTVKCNIPACRATVPLVRQTWLCKKSDRYVALKLVAPPGKKDVTFKVVESTSEKGLGFDPAAFSVGGNATCPFCGTVADIEFVKAEGAAGRMGHQLMAVACSRPNAKGKVYLAANDVPGLVPSQPDVDARLEAICSRSGLTVPSEPLPPRGTLGFRVQPYGFKTWGDLFSPRQKLSLLAFCEGIHKAEAEVRSLYDQEHSDALVVYLAALLDRLADFSSSFCVFNYTGGRGVKNTFGRQALPMVWDFAETNPFNPDAASWISGVADLPAGLRDAQTANRAHVVRGSATAAPFPDDFFDAVLTDPPYYDNVPYADISDFFYVWLKRTVGHLFPEHFGGELTPKKSEAIADPSRHGGDAGKARSAYESMMGQSLANAWRVLKPGGLLTLVYAHKTTSGWATLVDALRRSGFEVTEAWPLDTEKEGRLRAQDSAALASSIFLVARKRGENGAGSYEATVRPELEEIVRARVDVLWEQGITGADLVIAAVGAGLRAFTRFARVEYDNGEDVPAERFLAEVEGVVLDTLLAKVFGVARAKVSAVDGPSRFYVLWRYAYGTAELEAGEAIVFAYGQQVELDGADGLSGGRRALVRKHKSTFRLRDFSERGDEDDLGIPDDEQAPLIDVLHRVLWLVENSPRGLKAFLDQAQPDLDRLRLVAQALAGPGLKGGTDDDGKPVVTTTPAEQAALGKLLANWRALIEATVPMFSSSGPSATPVRKPQREKDTDSNPRLL